MRGDDNYMGKVDRDLDAILDFCRNFRITFLEEMSGKADQLMSIANDINSTLRGTQFATKSQEGVITMAKKIKNAVDTGEARILQLEKKVREQRERGEEFMR